MTTVLPDRLGRRRLARYERALEAKLFEGTIPVFSDDPEEQEALDAAHESIAFEHARAQQLMLAHLDTQASALVDLREALGGLLAAMESPRTAKATKAWDFARQVLER